MLTLTTIADQSDTGLWGYREWLALVAILLVLRGVFVIGREVGRGEVRRAMLRHPALRTRHADKQIREVA